MKCQCSRFVLGILLDLLIGGFMTSVASYLHIKPCVMTSVASLLHIKLCVMTSVASLLHIKLCVVE